VLGDADGATTHVSRHLGAFGVALGVALLFCAWRPERAHALLPFTGVLIGCTVVASLVDIIDGGLDVITETPHVPELTALALQWWIAGSPQPRLGRRGRRLRPAAH
jgi:predicted anti-sigma-YlaC factor YlaD